VSPDPLIVACSILMIIAGFTTLPRREVTYGDKTYVNRATQIAGWSQLLAGLLLLGNIFIFNDTLICLMVPGLMGLAAIILGYENRKKP
jgi:hypothetical protein